MARNNPKVSPEVAVELVDLARQMRRLIYGGDGVPEWGTKFSRIEAEALEVGRELSPSMQEKVALVGELLKSFPQAASAVDQLLGLTIGRMRFERVTERIGGERGGSVARPGDWADAIGAGHGTARGRAGDGA